MVSKEIIMTMIDKAVGEKCQPDYITALPYARATTVEEVDKRIEAIDNLISEEEKNIEDNIKKLDEYDEELIDIWNENKELEKNIEEHQSVIDAFHERDEEELEQNINDLHELLENDLPYSYIPEEWQEELYDVLTSGLYSEGTCFISDDKRNEVMEIVNKIDDYADNIRPISPDYMTNQDEAMADSMTTVTSEVESLITPSFILNGLKEDSDQAELELGELLESRELNEIRETEIGISQNKHHANVDKSETKIDKLTEERKKQERKKEKLQ